MKKVLVAIAAAALVILSATSCEKTCKCTATVAGESVSYTYTPEKGTKCSANNAKASVMGVSAEYKCVPQLF